jgi:hypothetical protein
MRLAQLARKISLKQIEIVEFLAQYSIEVEDTANAKLEDTHVQLVIEKLAPLLQLVIANELASAEPEEVIEASVSVVSPVSIQEEVVEELASVEEVQEHASEPIEETAEVIRAPKIELSGLKVLGKIELPEKKKKEELVTEEAGELVATETDKKITSRERIVKNDRKPKPQQRPSRNPLAEAREREKREEEEKRRQETERKKEIRTQNYMKKVQVKTPVKRAKPETTTTPKFQKVKKEEPKTLWGKFVKWLTT